MRTGQESAKYREGSKATAAAGKGQEGKRQKKKGESSASLTELSVNCVVAAILLPMPLWGEMLSGFGLLSEQATQREKGPRKIRQIHVENQISFPVRINMIYPLAAARTNPCHGSQTTQVTSRARNGRGELLGPVMCWHYSGEAGEGVTEVAFGSYGEQKSIQRAEEQKNGKAEKQRKKQMLLVPTHRATAVCTCAEPQRRGGTDSCCPF